MKKYDLEMERENISKGYTRAEVLEMLVDLFDTVFYSDGDVHEELKDNLNNEERIGLEEKE